MTTQARRKIGAVTRKIFPVTLWTMVAVWVLLLLALLGWAFITSLKSAFDYYDNPLGLPRKDYGGWQWSNYKTAFNAIGVERAGVKYGILRLLLNSMLFAVGGGAISVITACLASYILAKYSYLKWVHGLWIIVLLTNYMPISSSLAANIKFMVDLKLYDSMAGMWFWQSGGFGYIFLIYFATWKSVSWEYAEAAFIDGASHLRVMLQVMWPMTVTIFGVLTLNQFIALWNDYMTPLVYMPSWPNVSYGAWLFQFNVDNPLVAVPPIQLAGMLIIAAPVFVLFMIFRNKMMGSMTLGGLKG